MQVSTDATIDPSITYNNYYSPLNNLATNTGTLIIIICVIVLFIVLFSSLGSSGSGSGENLDSTGNNGYQSGVSFLGVFLGMLLAFGIILAGLDYFYGTSVYASVKNLFTNNPEIDLTLDQRQPPSDPDPTSIPQIISGDQVFNIPGNYYGFEDAKSLCTAYGARLASYDEIENAYTDGAEWCNYGWSQNQLALFPTQKKTYDNLQTIPGHENDCGRPGINGGFMKNPHIKYGVNCFGQKPDITPDETMLMSNTTPYPKTEKDIAMEERVEYWKSRLNDILVSPFNSKQWSRM